MHLPALLPFLPLLASLAAGQSQSQAYSNYRTECPQNDGYEEEIREGVFVTFHCAKRPVSRKATVVNAESPHKCAMACVERSGCESSVFAGKNLRGTNKGHCILYPDTFSSLKDESNVVYMTYRVEDDPFGNDDPFGGGGDCSGECVDEKAEISELEERIDSLQRDLAKCKKDCTGGCFQCPDYDRRTYVDRGNKYKVYCGKLDDWGAANLNFYGDRTPKECVEACTDTEDCTRAIWPTALASNAKGGCWLREYTAKAGPVPKTDSTVYSGAHLQ